MKGHKKTKARSHKKKFSSNDVTVLIRCRALASEEEDSNESSVRISSDESSISVRDAKSVERSYQFSCVPDGSKNQKYIFDRSGKHIVHSVLSGYNGAILAYGQTGSGKSYTMYGSCSTGIESGHFSAEQGVIYQACKTLFAGARIAHENEKSVRFQVWASYIEIYNDNLIDLLASHGTPTVSKNEKLQIREDPKGETVVVGQTCVEVNNPEDCHMLLNSGSNHRHVGATKMNNASSRSHAIFSLRIEKNYPESTLTQISRLHLVDLAGSERQKRTNACGIRMTGAKEINKSLSTLGNVLNSLATVHHSSSSRKRVPSYRDSKLTFFLKDCLGGNSKLSIIVTISSASNSAEETISTLEFAKRCTAVQNSAVVNTGMTRNVELLQSEAIRLRDKVQNLQATISNGSRRDHAAKLVLNIHRGNLPCSCIYDISYTKEENTLLDLEERIAERGVGCESGDAFLKTLRKAHSLSFEVERGRREERSHGNTENIEPIYDFLQRFRKIEYRGTKCLMEASNLFHQQWIDILESNGIFEESQDHGQQMLTRRELEILLLQTNRNGPSVDREAYLVESWIHSNLVTAAFLRHVFDIEKSGQAWKKRSLSKTRILRQNKAHHQTGSNRLLFPMNTNSLSSTEVCRNRKCFFSSDAKSSVARSFNVTEANYPQTQQIHACNQTQAHHLISGNREEMGHINLTGNDRSAAEVVTEKGAESIAPAENFLKVSRSGTNAFEKGWS